MVKGVARRVVVVRPERGDLFEQAIFILKNRAPGAEGRSPEDILREACRIACSCGRKRRLPQGALYSLCAAAGAALVGAAWLLCVLLQG